MVIGAPVVEHWLEQEILSGSPLRTQLDDPSHHEWMLYHGATSRS